MFYDIHIKSVKITPRLGVNEPTIFHKDFSSYDYFNTFGHLCENRGNVGFFTSLIIPVRTDTLTNFLQDFFFPTLFKQH